MSDTERVIGELKEFKRVTLKEVDHIRADLSDMKQDIKSLMNFKWRVAGGAAVLSIVVPFVIEVFRFWKIN